MDFYPIFQLCLVKLCQVQLSVLGHYFSLRDFSFWDGQKEEQNEDEMGKKKELCKGVIIS